MLEGFIERYMDEFKEQSGSKDGSDSTETYKSDIDPYYYEKLKRKRSK